MSETECKYWSFDGGNSQRGICAIDNKFCDCLVGERDCYYKKLKKCEQKLEKIKHIMNVLNNVGYYKDLEKTVLQIIEGAENE